MTNYHLPKRLFFTLLALVVGMLWGCSSVEETPSNVKNEENGTSADFAIYTVKHYKQDLNEEGYTVVEYDTTTLTGTVGNKTSATAKDYEGFTTREFEQQIITPDGKMVVKIYYDRKVVTLTLNCDNRTAAKTITGKFGADVKVDVPTKTGYTFSAWNPELPVTFPAEDTQYTAKWVKESDYTITYELNGGTNADENPVSYNVETETITLKPTVKSGYIFDGWYKENSFTTKVTEIVKGSTGNITLYAKWTDFVLVKGATITGKIADSNVFIDGRTVTISSFYMCNHEVTQAEYKAITGSLPTIMAIADGDSDNNPVNGVSWYDAVVYCNKRSMKEGLTPCYSISGSTDPAKWGITPILNNSAWDAATCDFTANGYRLPTEVEWEYAARGGNGLKGTQYTYAGSDNIDEVAWGKDNSNNKTHEVKTKKANSLGLYDMSGNVSELLWDLEDHDPSHSRYVGGGDWYYGAKIISDIKYGYYPYEGDNMRGFRLVRTAE